MAENERLTDAERRLRDALEEMVACAEAHGWDNAEIANARAALNTTTAEDIRWLCAATMPEAIAYRLHDRGVVVVD